MSGDCTGPTPAQERTSTEQSTTDKDKHRMGSVFMLFVSDLLAVISYLVV
jgi:hypothetical protein